MTNFIEGKRTVLGGTPSENEIIFLLASHRTNKEIALLNNISEKEVRERIKNICKRCGLKTKKELEYHCRELIGTIIVAPLIRKSGNLQVIANGVE